MTDSARRMGFTLIEVVVVVAVISLMTSIAIPAYLQYRRDAQAALFMNQLRVARDAFKSYNIKNGTYPPDMPCGEEPSIMHGYLPHMNWSNATPIGGLWDWDATNYGISYGLSVREPDRTDEEMREIDMHVDDGNILTGNFLKKVDRFIFVLEP